MRFKDILYLILAVLLTLAGISSILFLSFNAVVQMITTGISYTALGGLILYLITSVPSYQAAGEWIARGLSSWKKAEKRAVALRIERRLNSIQEEINNEVKDLFPYPAKVEWIEKPSFLNTEEEKIIIRMREHEENPRNVAYGVIDYVSNGMIPFSRLYLENSIQTAMDSTMIRSILLERDPNALDYFLSNVLNKKLDDEDVQRYVGVMNNLEQRGLFTRIFLEEARELGLKLYPIQNPNAREEMTEFVEHLNILATREIGELGTANPFNGDIIKTAYILIAKAETLRTKGFDPYLHYALRCLDMGAETIYLLSRGTKNKAARRLAQTMAKTLNLEIINISEYKELEEEEEKKALCVELRTN